MVSDDMPSNESMTGKGNASGESNMAQSDQAQAWSGNSVEYDSVIGEYTNRAYDSLPESNLPDSMKELVRDYFSDLNE